jgi:hypothetical protein
MTEAHTEGTREPRRIPSLMQATWEAATADPDPLAALGATRALVALLSTWEAQLVGEAVANGATWETIGSSVGVSRQAAWQRFHDDSHDFRHRVKTEMHDLRNKHRDEMVGLREHIKDEAAERGRGRGRRRPTH